VEAIVTPDEKREVLRRLVSIEAAVRSIAEFAEDAAEIAKQSDAPGLAFSLLMLKEAIKSYGEEMNKWAKSTILS
jgi:hypothetical protein